MTEIFNPTVDIGRIISANRPLSLQSSALQDITTTPAHTAAFAVPWELFKGSLARTTVSLAPETPPPTSMVPLTSCSAKVRLSACNNDSDKNNDNSS